jgi:transposase
MRKLREVFRLKFEFCYSIRQIAQSVGISAGSVSEYLFLFKVSGLTWDEVRQHTDEQLEQAIYKHPPSKDVRSRPQPDWAKIRVEMQRKEMTLSLLWSEYKAQHPDGLGYNVAVMPTRVVAPRDKAKVESAVQIVERQIIGPLRHQTFTSLLELNQAIRVQLDEVNKKPMQRIGLSRLEQFEQIEKGALRPLPRLAFLHTGMALR